MPVGHTREQAREPEAVEQGGAAEQGDTVDALVQLSFLVQGVLARMASEHDLSLIQVRLLGILRDRRPGMLELARLLGLDKSSMTGLVSRAEKRGLVRRVPSPDDGRAVLVELTAAGRELTGRCTAGMGREIAALTASLTTGERAQVTALAGKILGNAQETGAG
ncbi:MarR family winged helix-turn-helix transcriptional regulator [Streptomyces sp. NPDC048243]|uniref:MarR family winged helix-turn-helix transcriptional regulator n=1 Tax=unclassified Streptomyces TaxID=2593676 RepID=UPI0037243E57